MALWAAPMLVAVFLCKVSVPPLSGRGLGIGIPLILLVALVGCVAGKFELEPRRLAIYLLMVAWAGAGQLFGKSFSLPSLLFLVCLFAPYVFRLRRDGPGDAHFDIVRLATRLGFWVSLLACGQLLVQRVAGPAFAYPIEHALPRGFIIEQFHYLNPLYYGSTLFKANGVFFLEPSFFSQFVAIALLLEINSRNRMLRVLVMACGLAASYSGTGLIVLACGLIAFLCVRRRWDFLLAIAFVMVLAALVGDLLRLDIFMGRALEFSQIGSSGFERFVAWTYLLRDYFWNDPARVWFGLGAGSFDVWRQVARYNVFESSFAKMIFEFGLPGIAIYFGFHAYCIFSSRLPVSVKIGLMVSIFMNGAYSEQNTGILLSLALWAPYTRPDARGTGALETHGNPRERPSLFTPRPENRLTA